MNKIPRLGLRLARDDGIDAFSATTFFPDILSGSDDNQTLSSNYQEYS